jgi:putative flippase GtrA
MKDIQALVKTLYNHRFLRYLAVGGTTFIISEGLLVILHGGFKLWLPLATVLAYTVSFVYNFCLNRWWTFSSADSKNLKQHLVPYAALFIFNLVFSAITVPILSHFINYAIAYPLVVILQTTWTYYIYKNFICIKHEVSKTTEN